MQFIVSRERDGWMLSAILRQEAAEIPIWAIKEAIKKRDVRVDGEKITADIRVKAGQEIRVFFPKAVLAQQEKKSLPLPEIAISP